MRIGIDGGSWTNRRGYGRFLHEIVDALAKLKHGHQFVMFLDTSAAREFPSLPGFSICEVPLSQQVSEAAKHDGNRSLMDLLRMSRAVAKEPLDVFFFPTVYSYFPLLRRVPCLLGIHDTIADRNPQYAFASFRQRLLWQAKLRAAIWQSHLVMTVSEYSRECLMSVHGIAEERIWIVPEAAASRFRPPSGHGAREPFVLYVGGISPNKNLSTLVRAMALLDTGINLKLVGDYQSDGFRSCYAEIRAVAQTLGLQNRVTFLGFVPDEELVHLYQSASLFVMPSFDEGFGLPAIEAMASGVPVIVSQGNSLEEVVADAGLTFRADDTGGLATAMNRVLGDPDLWLQLSEAGLERAAVYSWKHSASVLLNLFEEVSHCR